jgi:plasmid stabilization system protein ParE
MAYLVNITVRAERDLARLYQDIHASDSAAARRWYFALTGKILSLEKKPNRCPMTPENPQLRHLLLGRKPHVYRVIYRVLETPKRVDVLHVRHGARRSFTGVA